MEKIYIQKIESGIRGIKLGTKKPEDVDILSLLEKLRPLNEARYEELMVKFLRQMKEYKKKFGTLK